MRKISGPRFSVVFSAVAALALTRPAPGQEVRVSAGTVEDRRTTGRFFGGLEVELKLTGDDLADARSARILLKKAVDETGRDLLPENRRDEDFSSVGSQMKVSLKNPARGASALKEISGDVELYVPSRDPASVVTVDRVMSRMDRAVDAPALRSQKIAVRVVSPKAHRAAAKKRDAEFEKEMEKHKEEMKQEAGDDKTAEALMALVKGFSGMMNEVGDNDLILEVEDEQKKVLDVSVFGPKGNPIDTRGSMSSGTLRILQFGEKLPADAKLKILLQTRKSIVSAPFSLTNVPLP
jgi:hypothetical protein